MVVWSTCMILTDMVLPHCTDIYKHMYIFLHLYQKPVNSLFYVAPHCVKPPRLLVCWFWISFFPIVYYVGNPNVFNQINKSGLLGYIFIEVYLLLYIQFSHSGISDSLWPHGLQHSRLLCPSATPGVTETHVLQVGDAIQPSYPLPPPSPSTFSLSHHQGPFQWVSSSHQVAKVLEFQLQHQSFQWIFRIDFL